MLCVTARIYLSKCLICFLASAVDSEHGRFSLWKISATGGGGKRRALFDFLVGDNGYVDVAIALTQ